VPAQSVRRRAPAPGDPQQARDLLSLAIGTGVTRLKAAGIRSSVRLLDFTEQQRSTDYLTGVQPLRVKETGATGIDAFPDKGGLFGVTEFGESTFR
jgi:hypothetical protein